MSLIYVHWVTCSHSWKNAGKVKLNVGGQYNVGGSYPTYANGVYCSKCHMSAWCYKFESKCGAHGSGPDSLLAVDYVPSGWSVWDDSTVNMTFSKYKTWAGG